MREGEARAPPVARRIDPQPLVRRPRRRSDRIEGEDDPLRIPRRPGGRDDERVALFDRHSTGERGAPRGGDDVGRPDGREQPLAGRRWEAVVDRPGGVAVVEAPLQLIEEEWPGWDVEGDKPAHGGTLTAAMATEDGLIPAWKHVAQYTDITYETAEGIAKITICRPEVRNAFRPQTLIELADAFDSARDDPEVGVIILTGSGDQAFCSGGDQRIRGDDGYLGDDEVAKRGIGRLNVLDLQIQIRRLPKPVVAMVAGYAIGGGHVLHLVCDLTIAADNARFGQTGPRVGSFDAGFGAGLLAKTIGTKRAKEIWFLCRQYDAERAYEMGLVNAVVPLADLEAETVSWCREMLALSPIALRMLKAGFNAADDGLAGIQQLAGDATMLFYMSEEGQEGRNAYVEKRKPDFSRFPRRP